MIAKKMMRTPTPIQKNLLPAEPVPSSPMAFAGSSGWLPISQSRPTSRKPPTMPETGPSPKSIMTTRAKPLTECCATSPDSGRGGKRTSPPSQVPIRRPSKPPRRRRRPRHSRKCSTCRKSLPARWIPPLTWRRQRRTSASFVAVQATDRWGPSDWCKGRASSRSAIVGRRARWDGMSVWWGTKDVRSGPPKRWIPCRWLSCPSVLWWKWWVISRRTRVSVRTVMMWITRSNHGE
mmetsp:Transcript_35648/g.82879  ORF Transcript_35648/g.82879 Transcript_35648/m.82879 type:complete len:235 (-) Transcript_35648:3178-3882(-)